MANILSQKDYEVTIFAPTKSVSRLRKVIGLPFYSGIRLIDFSTNTSPLDLRTGLSTVSDWTSRLPSLEQYDKVICDNLPEILEVRPDASLSAQFFWHDAIAGESNDYKLYCERLLVSQQPLIIGHPLFSMRPVRQQPNFLPVGLFKLPALELATLQSIDSLRTDLLITGGSTNILFSRLTELVCNYTIQRPNEYQNVFVDPQLFPDNAPEWILKADFSIDMYCRIKASICRPGLGVVTDLLTVDAEIYPVYEEGNAEMAHNASVLKSFTGKPKEIGGPDTAWWEYL